MAEMHELNLQDERNQLLTTNLWLNLVGFPLLYTELLTRSEPKFKYQVDLSPDYWQGRSNVSMFACNFLYLRGLERSFSLRLVWCLRPCHCWISVTLNANMRHDMTKMSEQNRNNRSKNNILKCQDSTLLMLQDQLVRNANFNWAKFENQLKDL